MSILAQGMMGAGITALAAGVVLVRPRFIAATGLGKVLALGPVAEGIALAIFAAEHFLAAPALAAMVPAWLPARLFWVWLVGVALLAAAISFLAWRCVHWSSSLLAVLFLTIVATIDLPNLLPNLHSRLFWTLTFRETCFAAGALVLAGSSWPQGRPLLAMGRTLVACTFFFYAIQHFLFPRNVPGVPLEKLMPAWTPAPVLLSYLVGIVLLAAGIGLLLRCTARLAAAAAGSMLLLLTAFFYLPILLIELNSPLVVEGVNYVGDTLLFTGTALLAGFGENGAA